MQQPGLIPGFVLDIVLLGVILTYGVFGYRRGLFLSFVSTVGFVLGAAAAWWLLPGRVEAWVPPRFAPIRHVILLMLMVLIGTLGQVIMLWLARLPYQTLRAGRVRTVDSVLGSVVAAAVAAVMLWFGSGVARLSLPDVLGSPIKDSRLLAGINTLMPASSERLVTRTLVALKDSGFPRVFGEGSVTDIAPVDPPDPALEASALVRAVRPSVLPIHAVAPRCNRSQEGTGWVIQPTIVVTNAHVVAGANEVQVGRGEEQRTSEVIAFDPVRDLAVLRVPGLNAAPLPLGGPMKRGENAIVVGYPLGGPYRADAARVRGDLVAEGDDIYGEQPSTRSVIALRAGIHPGNSGGPLLSPEGRVTGVIFARSVSDTNTAYALSLEELRSVMGKAAAAKAPVGTGRCT